LTDTVKVRGIGSKKVDDILEPEIEKMTFACTGFKVLRHSEASYSQQLVFVGRYGSQVVFSVQFHFESFAEKSGETLGYLGEGSNGGSSVTSSIASSSDGGSGIGSMGNWGSGKGNLESML